MLLKKYEIHKTNVQNENDHIGIRYFIKSFETLVRRREDINIKKKNGFNAVTRALFNGLANFGWNGEWGGQGNRGRVRVDGGKSGEENDDVATEKPLFCRTAAMMDRPKRRANTRYPSRRVAGKRLSRPIWTVRHHASRVLNSDVGNNNDKCDSRSGIERAEWKMYVMGQKKKKKPTLSNGEIWHAENRSVWERKKFQSIHRKRVYSIKTTDPNPLR